jgi:hypothetical protein
VVAEGHEHNEPGVTRDPRIDLLFAGSRDEAMTLGIAVLPTQKQVVVARVVSVRTRASG